MTGLPWLPSDWSMWVLRRSARSGRAVVTRSTALSASYPRVTTPCFPIPRQRSFLGAHARRLHASLAGVRSPLYHHPSFNLFSSSENKTTRHPR